MNQTQSLPEKVKKGLHYFNQGAFYEAHEYFEDAWRQTPGSSREFYRSLLHISGGFFRLQQGRAVAAKKFFMHALNWLKQFPDEHLGFDLSAIKKIIENLLKKLTQDKHTERVITEMHPLLQSIFIKHLPDS
ncbi:MAG: DUF309 domain-containing protein [Anaerolineales bacterium]|jgi:hypothetical protein